MFDRKKVTYFILKNLSPNRRDFVLGLKRFNLKKRECPDRQLFIMFCDGQNFHGGLTDRFKGIVSTFHYCLCKGIEFRINHTCPFNLSDFLTPHKYNWELTYPSDKISNHLFEAKYLNIIGETTSKRLINLKTKKQIHCYANSNIVPELNAYYHADYEWGKLFKVLFRPTQELMDLVYECKSKIAGEYICAVFRFQQLLGDFKEYQYAELSDIEKSELIQKCKQATINLQNTSDCKKILVTSDSVSFLKMISDRPDIYTFPSKVVHIDTVEGESHKVYLKSFLDFYLLSEGTKIYSIGTKEMYPSEFPLYASKLNNIPFERILIV